MHDGGRGARDEEDSVDIHEHIYDHIADRNASGKSSEQPTGKRPTNARYKYRMPVVYAEFVRNLVVEDPDVKLMDARTMMLDALGLSKRQLPKGFPSEYQVRLRITGIKYKEKKKDVTK